MQILHMHAGNWISLIRLFPFSVKGVIIAPFFNIFSLR